MLKELAVLTSGSAMNSVQYYVQNTMTGIDRCEMAVRSRELGQVSQVIKGTKKSTSKKARPEADGTGPNTPF